MKGKVYQQIVDTLDGIIPCIWDEILFWAEEDRASYSYVFYIKSDGEYIQCYNLPGLDRDVISSAFKCIRKDISAAREKDDTWTEMTLRASLDGKFKADFDYIDLSTESYEYSKRWKKKYLQ